MKELGCFIFAFFVVLAAGLGLTWLVQGNQFFLYQYFAPKEEAVRRETFEQSKAYRQGMVQELQSMRFEYAKAGPEHRQALASLILHRSADFDRDAMPADLRDFIDGLRNPSPTTQPSY